MHSLNHQIGGGKLKEGKTWRQAGMTSARRKEVIGGGLVRSEVYHLTTNYNGGMWGKVSCRKSKKAKTGKSFIRYPARSGFKHSTVQKNSVTTLRE